MVAVELMAELRRIADELERHGDPSSPYHPPHATLTIGLMHGGTAVNILARECTFTFDLRTPPGQDPDKIIVPFLDTCATAHRMARERFAGAGVSVIRRSATPSFAPEPDGAAETLARRLAGDNGPTRAAAYAAEAGQFQGAGFSTIICGPGSIEQAHQADEFIDLAQFERGAAFMARLGEALA